ncbi:fasciclin domain-containing protein [Saccharothrix australiensis]|uniref:Putative surface protein with fasciclin (FAS1) repeats n=1 Tax=Saccharothrix australiensis TaxID=2072 RepID=A0A495VYW2_9PSEU|nr:fasciclin domain-containing protein [Saccharothrix australiensis]RKT54611.1 putative surface protein with fasciclin (FAS1) repeats [Saccharothrix australiensis]
MRSTRFASVVGVLAATLLAAACGGGGEQATSTTTTSTATTSTATTATTSTAGTKAAGGGVTRTGDVFGAGCAGLPKAATDEGSLDGMVDDPVATAASNNPLLTKLVAAVKAAGLVDTLNKADAGYTVFAPYDPAFEALGKEALDAVLADKPKLTGILTHHVVPQRMDRDGILSAATLTTVQGDALKVSGSGDDITVNGAKVLCGNIPTANATVFVIDKVMMPAS